MDLTSLRYIAIEGPIGVGKTSLARKLSAHLHTELLLERPDDNPFLERFYSDRARYALPTQLNFLFQRADQIKPLSQFGLFSERRVADFTLDKDPIFARMNLADDEFALYSKMYAFLQPQAPAPDLLIVLHASVDQLLTRIERRGIRYEQSIDAAYLEQLSAAYTQQFQHYDRAPVLYVNTNALNFVDQASHFSLLLERLHHMRTPREFLPGDAR